MTDERRLVWTETRRDRYVKRTGVAVKRIQKFSNKNVKRLCLEKHQDLHSFGWILLETSLSIVGLKTQNGYGTRKYSGKVNQKNKEVAEEATSRWQLNSSSGSAVLVLLLTAGLLSDCVPLV